MGMAMSRQRASLGLAHCARRKSQVNETQPKADVRFNYHRLIEILTSPEAAKLPQSQEAAAIVNSVTATSLSSQDFAFLFLFSAVASSHCHP